MIERPLNPTQDGLTRYARTYLTGLLACATIRKYIIVNDSPRAGLRDGDRHMEDFDYTVESGKGFDETVAAIEAKSAEKGFRVLVVHDVKATLESKGFAREPMKIVEICNAKYVSQVLEKDIKIALMLPCPVVVYAQGNKIFISTLRPRVMADFYPAAGVSAIASEVDEIVLSIINEARQ